MIRSHTSSLMFNALSADCIRLMTEMMNDGDGDDGDEDEDEDEGEEEAEEEEG